MTNLFPMFLKFEGRQCLVVGAGKVGEPKIAGLLDTGARIRVVALDASPAVREWARAGRIELDLLHSLASREAFEAARAEASELVPHGEHK